MYFEINCTGLFLTPQHVLLLFHLEIKVTKSSSAALTDLSPVFLNLIKKIKKNLSAR